MTAPTRRHLSMLRSYTWADALTIGNAACGTIAIFLCLDYLAEGSPRYLWTAFLLLPLALVLDVLDGYVARLDRRRQSVLGADLDSLPTSSRSGLRRPCSASRSACAAAGTCSCSATSWCAA
jgi:CDP-diacylglycerol--serine O-phosphatidyltransferase